MPKELLYPRNYKPGLVHFLPHFSVWFIIKILQTIYVPNNFIIKSSFESRAIYNGTCMVIKKILKMEPKVISSTLAECLKLLILLDSTVESRFKKDFGSDQNPS